MRSGPASGVLLQGVLHKKAAHNLRWHTSAIDTPCRQHEMLESLGWGLEALVPEHCSSSGVEGRPMPVL